MRAVLVEAVHAAEGRVAAQYQAVLAEAAAEVQEEQAMEVRWGCWGACWLGGRQSRLRGSTQRWPMLSRDGRQLASSHNHKLPNTV